MDLKPNAGSDRAWVWNTLADYADECPKAEFLAIRFLNAESKYLCITHTASPHYLRKHAAGIINLKWFGGVDFISCLCRCSEV